MFRTKIAVRRARRNASDEQKAQCDKVLASNELLSALDEDLHEQHAAANGSGSITTFLDWLIANLPAILAAVASIIALFGG